MHRIATLSIGTLHGGAGMHRIATLSIGTLHGGAGMHRIATLSIGTLHGGAGIHRMYPDSWDYAMVGRMHSILRGSAPRAPNWLDGHQLVRATKSEASRRRGLLLQ